MNKLLTIIFVLGICLMLIPVISVTTHAYLYHWNDVRLNTAEMAKVIPIMFLGILLAGIGSINTKTHSYGT